MKSFYWLAEVCREVRSHSRTYNCKISGWLQLWGNTALLSTHHLASTCASRYILLALVFQSSFLFSSSDLVGNIFGYLSEPNDCWGFESSIGYLLLPEGSYHGQVCRFFQNRYPLLSEGQIRQNTNSMSTTTQKGLMDCLSKSPLTCTPAEAVSRRSEPGCDSPSATISRCSESLSSDGDDGYLLPLQKADIVGSGSGLDSSSVASQHSRAANLPSFAPPASLRPAGTQVRKSRRTGPSRVSRKTSKPDLSFVYPDAILRSTDDAKATFSRLKTALDKFGDHLDASGDRLHGPWMLDKPFFRKEYRLWLALHHDITSTFMAETGGSDGAMSRAHRSLMNICKFSAMLPVSADIQRSRSAKRPKLKVVPSNVLLKYALQIRCQRPPRTGFGVRTREQAAWVAADLLENFPDLVDPIFAKCQEADNALTAFDNRVIKRIEEFNKARFWVDFKRALDES